MAEYDFRKAYKLMKMLVDSEAEELPTNTFKDLSGSLEEFTKSLDDYTSVEDAHKALEIYVKKCGVNNESHLSGMLGSIVDLYVGAKIGQLTDEQKEMAEWFDPSVYPKGSLYAVVSKDDITRKLGE